MAKRILTFVLAVQMLLSLTACDGGTPAASGNQGGGGSKGIPEYMNMESQMPIVKEGTDITLRIMVVNGPMYSNMGSLRDVYFTEAYEKKTGVKIEWIEVSSDAFADQLSLKLMTGELPDIILKGGISNATQLENGYKEGFFLDLMENDLLQTYAPNYWALCQEYPEILSASMMPDGQVYSLGMVRNSTGSTIASKLFFNKEWLANVGLDVPTNIDEFTAVLRAFKNDDPIGNNRNDE